MAKLDDASPTVLERLPSDRCGSNTRIRLTRVTERADFSSFAQDFLLIF